jgi:hypothetical protein
MPPRRRRSQPANKAGRRVSPPLPGKQRLPPRRGGSFFIYMRSLRFPCLGSYRKEEYLTAKANRTKGSQSNKFLFSGPFFSSFFAFAVNFSSKCAASKGILALKK